ncbi:hypothetical protein FIBSPDRAFT_927897 [Athelia psychrophila]|uniref:Uncharacterized protein n=1 Tax=Athelia psychrophila TaxID=1759441 RepID=A0A166R5K4_9AGAM|nr:hypothetical protein FIBSPDRAFT_927897 [Fibularhizoctonia sp. CBS 109695]
MKVAREVRRVEDTVKEEITDQDLVRIQLLLGSSTTLAAFGLTTNAIGPAQGCATQLRRTAEDPAKDFHPPAASTPVPSRSPQGAEYVSIHCDSLLAKIVDLGEASQRAVRAPRETSTGNEKDAGVVKTDKVVLAGWWRAQIGERDNVIRIGTEVLKPRVGGLGIQEHQDTWEVTVTSASASASGSGSLPMQPGAISHLVFPAWNQYRRGHEEAHPDTRLHRARQLLHSPLRPAPTHLFARPLRVLAQAGPVVCQRLCHVDGKIIELHPAVLAESGMVAKGDTIVVQSVMKVECVVMAPRAGRVVRRGKPVEVGVVVWEGMLLAVVNSEELSKSRL